MPALRLTVESSTWLAWREWRTWPALLVEFSKALRSFAPKRWLAWPGSCPCYSAAIGLASPATVHGLWLTMATIFPCSQNAPLHRAVL